MWLDDNVAAEVTIAELARRLGVGLRTLERRFRDQTIWMKISDHPGSAMQHFTSGAVEVTGNAMLATKLPPIIA